MTIDSVIAPELLSAEIEAIEDLLVHYEDWRALTQLELRERQGEVPSNMATSGLKAMLIEKLANNPLFLRRQTLLKELERITQSVRTPTQPITFRTSELREGDDLTRIRGIDSRLERRLNALNVRTFSQIARFSLDDVRYVSSTLGLENRIISQMWIEQAELLATSGAGSTTSVGMAEEAVRFSTRMQPAMVPPASPHYSGDMASQIPPRVETTGVIAEQSPAGPKIVSKAPHEIPANISTRNVAPSPAVPPPTNKPVQPGPPVSAPLPARSTVMEPVTLQDNKSIASSSAPAPTRQVESMPRDFVDAATPVPNPDPKIQPAKVPKLAPQVRSEIEEPSFENLVPPTPLAAGNYKSKHIDAEMAALASLAAAKVPEIDHASLRPAFPLAAKSFVGALLDPIDHGVLEGALPPPKPRPASTYAAPKVKDIVSAPANSVGGAASSQQPRPAPVGTPPPLVKKDAGDERLTAADIVGGNIPALPLRPAASTPPEPLPRHSAPPPPAGAAVAPPHQQAPTAASAAAIAAKEAAMLAAAAARGSAQSSSIRIPPPLPPVGRQADVGPIEPAPPQSVRPPPSAREDLPAAPLEFRAGFGPTEARVTIRRSEEHASGPVVRAPGATEVHLGREQRRQATQFDSASYAAYHGEVEEASVQIIRRRDGSAPTVRAGPEGAGLLQPSSPTPVPQASFPAPPGSVKAAQAQPVASAQNPTGPKQAEKPMAPIGRFLKALTGQ